MASPRNIYPVLHQNHYRQEVEHPSSYGRSFRLESTSLESNRTDLSVNSRDVVVAGMWLVLGKIGEGSFGEVFEVRDVNTKRHYAIKRETKKSKNPQLKYENMMYDVLAGGAGIPQCHWYGEHDGFDCIVMDLLGPNLNQVRENVSYMELDIAVDLVCQMVSIVEHIHGRGVLLRDVKPDNFLFPPNCYLPEAEMIESNDDDGMPVTTYKKPTCKQVFGEQWGEPYPKLYAVDFGLACNWRDPETKEAYPDTGKKPNRNKTGTARYASINVHQGRIHSRRDDMESIGYILLDLLLGFLPWTGISAKNSKMGWDRMKQEKMNIRLADLCAGLPVGVLKFVEYPRSLKFLDKPDYERMRNYLKESLPGGTFSEQVKSPFNGETRPAENYHIMPQEREELRQSHRRQQQSNVNNDWKARPSNDDDDHIGLFDMDDLTTQLDALSEPKPARQPRKNSTTISQSTSSHKLLKRNKTKKVGWNTHKHDQELWDTKPDWINEETSKTDNHHLGPSWGDDQQQQPPTTGNWGLVTNDTEWITNQQPLDDEWQQQVAPKNTWTTFSPRHSDPLGTKHHQTDNSHSSSTDIPPYRSNKPYRHNQPRRYSNPAVPEQLNQPPPPSFQNTYRKKHHGGKRDPRHNSSGTNTTFGQRHRRSSHHNNSTNLDEATNVDTITWSTNESTAAK